MISDEHIDFLLRRNKGWGGKMTLPREAAVEARGVKVTAQISEYADDPENFVLVKLFVDPSSPGLDREAYTRVVRAQPEEER